MLVDDKAVFEGIPSSPFEMKNLQQCWYW